jgi:hypothetical protein
MVDLEGKQNKRMFKRRFSAPKVIPRIPVERKYESNIGGVSDECVLRCKQVLPEFITEEKFDVL